MLPPPSSLFFALWVSPSTRTVTVATLAAATALIRSLRSVSGHRLLLHAGSCTRGLWAPVLLWHGGHGAGLPWHWCSVATLGQNVFPGWPAHGCGVSWQVSPPVGGGAPRAAASPALQLRQHRA